MSLEPGDFGARLRRARESRGLSLRDIANVTKISTLVLEALERGDAGRLPGGVFSRAFVREYAKQVGLDPEQAVRDFVEAFRVRGLVGSGCWLRSCSSSCSLWSIGT
jgi:transcriptional regulator with XRE-family HTH domain